MKAPLLTTAVALAALSPADAHLVDARFGDFFGGAMHVATALPYALVFLSACLLAVLHGPEGARRTVLAVPAAMLAGGLLAQPTEASALPLLVSAAAAGLASLLALGRTLPLSVLLAATSLAGAIVGFENGLATSEGTDAVLFLAGATAAGLVVVSLLTALTRRLAERAAWSALAFRAVGSWCLAVAVVLLALGAAGGTGGA